MVEITKTRRRFWRPTSSDFSRLTRPRRGSHARAAAGAPQRPDRPDDRGSQRARGQAHRRRRAGRIPLRGRRRALRASKFSTRWSSATPASWPDRRIEFRIGVHLGDVVEESDGDLMGDGVNVAARLEGIASPGAICLSEDAYRQVRARLDLAVSDLGETQLKNIAEPMRVYALEVGRAGEAKPPAPVQTQAGERQRPTNHRLQFCRFTT